MSEVNGILVKELCEAIGGGPAKYKALFKEGKIPGTQVGRRIYFDPEEVAVAVIEQELKIRGFRGLPSEPSEVEKRITEAEGKAFIAASEAALKFMREELLLAEQEGRMELQAALHRRIATMLDEKVGE